MAPSLIGDNYAKDLSQLPSFPGGSFVSHTSCFILPDDVVILRLTETTYDSADYHHIAVVEEVAFTDPEFIASHIDDLRDNDGLEDSEIVDRIMVLEMEDEDKSEVIARFAYDNFSFIDPNGNPAEGKQIRGAYVTPERAGAGLAGQIYRHLTEVHKHLICDNTQTVYGQPYGQIQFATLPAALIFTTQLNMSMSKS